MTIPTEPIGSVPSPVELIDGLARKDSDSFETADEVGDRVRP